MATALMGLALVGCRGPSAPQIDLDPTGWPATEYSAHLALDRNGGELGAPAPIGRKGIVASTTGSLATHAGLEALRQGGSAADAAMTTALTQVFAYLGGATSFGGHMVVYYYEAATGQVHALNASYASVLGETDPLTIPAYGTPSGRAVMVPGFIAGVEALHSRFGKLPFAELFEPAIHLADRGVTVNASMAAMLRQREQVVTRRPEGRAIFGNPGALPEEGQLFRQPALAGTLRRIASEGAAYMYQGPWAQKLVDAVRSEGGLMSLDDLRRYQPSWFEPWRTSYRGHEVYAPLPIIEAANLLELADLRTSGHHATSPESLRRFIQISRVADILGFPLADAPVPNEIVEAYLPGLDRSPGARATKEHARRVWGVMQSPAWRGLEREALAAQIEGAEAIQNLIKDFTVRRPGRPDHTAGVVAVDGDGNMAAVTHSVTSSVWGELGIFVDGISITDPGGFAQRQIARIGPGTKLDAAEVEAGCPMIVLRDGKPVLGCGSVGASYYEVSLQGMVNVLDFGMDAPTAAMQPQFRRAWPPGEPLRQPLGDGEFTRTLLEAVRALGIDLEVVEDRGLASSAGSWVGVTIDPASGELRGGLTSRRNWLVEAW